MQILPIPGKFSQVSPVGQVADEAQGIRQTLPLPILTQLVESPLKEGQGFAASQAAEQKPLVELPSRRKQTPL